MKHLLTEIEGIDAMEPIFTSYNGGKKRVLCKNSRITKHNISRYKLNQLYSNSVVEIYSNDGRGHVEMLNDSGDFYFILLLKEHGMATEVEWCKGNYYVLVNMSKKAEFDQKLYKHINVLREYIEFCASLT